MVYRKGKSVPHKYVIVFYRKNNLPYNRIAFLCSKKVGNSVCRSRGVRLMREGFRLLKKDNRITFRGYDVIFIGRKSMLEAKCDQVMKSMEAAMRKSPLLGRKAVIEKRKG